MNKCQLLPTVESKLSQMSKLVNDHEAKIEIDKKNSEDSLFKLQKSVTSHEAELREMTIKMKAFIVVNKEMDKIKSEKTSKSDFDKHRKWAMDNLVT